MTRGRGKLALRALVAVGLLVMLGGPGPGSVGSCSETELNVANAPQYCVSKREALCRRTRFMCGPGMPDCDTAYVMCTDGLESDCRPASWPGGCRPPTQVQADACVRALLADDPAHLAVPNDRVDEQFPECMEIQCRGTTMGLVAPEDASVPYVDGSTEVP